MRSRGRGRGRRAGQGGRGRGRGISGRRSGNRAWRIETKEPPEPVKDLDVNNDVMSYFVGSVSTNQHIAGQEQNRDRYAAGMAVLQKNGIDIAQNARIRALAAAWARHDFDLAEAFLQDRDNFGVNEVLKAMTQLDSGRQVRVLEKKIKRITTSGGNVKPKTLGKLKSDIDNLNKNKPLHGTASGAVCKHVKRWVRKFSKKELEFYALHFPKDPWKKLADICHFHPKQDPSYFCYGADAPESTIVHRCRDITEDNVNALIKEFEIPYTHVKPHLSKLTPESKARIAASEKKLDTVLWWYEDLKCEEVDKIILSRVEAGEEVHLPNGKLLERLLLLKMYRENISKDESRKEKERRQEMKTSAVDESKAPFFKHLIPLSQTKIDQITLSLESPIVVIGDASDSMDVAIKTSSIIAGLLTAICNAQLVFFDDKNRCAPYLPKNIEEVLQLAVDTVADNCTAPAASLWPFLEKKEMVKTFIIVTDERENTSCEGMRFDEMFQRYHDEVYPAKLVFVSFFSSQTDPGRMVPKLEARGFKPLRFVFDLHRPDLTKLDKMFGMLASETSGFDEEVLTMENVIKNGGLAKCFEKVDN